VRTAAIVRILTGLLFVAEGYSKLAGEFVSGGFGKDAVRMSHAAWPLWARFLQSTVIPNAATLAWVFALGELAVGIGLVLGLWTRVACAGGLALMALDPDGPDSAGFRRALGRVDHGGVDAQARVSAAAIALGRRCREGLGLGRPGRQATKAEGRTVQTEGLPRRFHHGRTELPLDPDGDASVV
jgi:hypothetical protein